MSITVYENLCSEFVTIRAFELFDTDGYTEVSKGYVKTEEEARKWQAKSYGYTTYKAVEKTITVFDTYEDLAEHREVVTVKEILAAMTPTQRELLFKHQHLL